MRPQRTRAEGHQHAEHAHQEGAATDLAQFLEPCLEAYVEQQEDHTQFRQHAQRRTGHDLVRMDQAERRWPDQATCDDLADDPGKLQSLRDFRADLRGDEDREEGQQDFGSMMHLAGSIRAGRRAAHAGLRSQGARRR